MNLPPQVALPTLQRQTPPTAIVWLPQVNHGSRCWGQRGSPAGYTARAVAAPRVQSAKAACSGVPIALNMCYTNSTTADGLQPGARGMKQASYVNRTVVKFLPGTKHVVIVRHTSSLTVSVCSFGIDRHLLPRRHPCQVCCCAGAAATPHCCSGCSPMGPAHCAGQQQVLQEAMCRSINASNAPNVCKVT